MKRTVILTLAVGLGLILCVGAGRSAASSPLAKQTAPQVVSFRRDVAPMIASGCTTVSCHGGGAHPPDLASDVDAAALRRALVSVSSEERLAMPYVRPGDPAGSYLMKKLDGSLDDADCTDHDCGARMPARNAALPEEARELVRAWIAQGARDN